MPIVLPAGRIPANSSFTCSRNFKMADTTPVQTLNPPTLWAQRVDTVLLTISVEDIENLELQVTDKRLFFHCKGGLEHHVYELDFQFYKEVDESNVKRFLTGRELSIVIKKKDPGTPYWPRLLDSKDKQHWLKVDFNRWKDEDDSDAEDDGSFEDMMKKMGGGVPQGEMLEGLNDEEDSDDEELPDLE